MHPTQVGNAEFLSELNESDSLAALRNAHIAKSVLVFAVAPKPIKSFIDNFHDKRAILPSEFRELFLPTDKEISIKFNVGTEVYFIKTFIKTHMNRYCFDMSCKVMQLKRRREPRYLIPKRWTQSAAIVLNSAKQISVACSVVDISQSGIRFEVAAKQTLPNFSRDDIIAIKFQIYKRAEVTASAIVRFALKRPGLTGIVGLEFANISDVQSKRVASIIEDIIMFSAVTKK